MDGNIFMQSIQAFHINAINGIVYHFTSNWCLIVLVAATVLSVILGVSSESASVIREEQNIL